MKDFERENLSHDPVHGYIPFIATAQRDSEVAEREIIDHPWVQRLRQIHQLQTAWWVYPAAEHTRFQHVLGAMHLASRAVAELYDSLQTVCPDVPSRGYVESLMRMAALLHDVGHGPFGHFFDAHFLIEHSLTHETLGAAIIREDLAELLRGVRRSPAAALERGEQLDPDQVAYLIVRPDESDDRQRPDWLRMLRSLFCGIYTVDNMDFVLRDAFMTGYSTQAYDLDRLLRYSFFTAAGLTIHRRGVDALVRFIRVRSELFRSVYFHRTVRAIDLTMADLFDESRRYLFSGNPLDHREEYLRLTEWSLFVEVSRWPQSDDPRQRELGLRWQKLLARELDWKAACERNLIFAAGETEASSLFSDPELVEQSLRKTLGPELAELPMRVDLARHIHRPHARAAAAKQNFLCDAAGQDPRPLADDQLFRQLPIAGRICRIYVPKPTPDTAVRQITAALDDLLGPAGRDDLTNM